MKTTFYQLEGGGNWILSPDINDQVKGNYYLKDLKYTDGVWNLGIMDPKDNSYLIASKPIIDFIKENGQPFRSPEEIERICGRFFGAASISSVTSDGFLYLPNSATGLRIRIGQREGFVYAIDEETAVNGFSGSDWENIGGKALT